MKQATLHIPTLLPICAGKENCWVKADQVSVPELWSGAVSPRFAPVLLCRIAHPFYRLELGPVAKAISLINFFLFGIENAVRCPLGPGLLLPHTQGLVTGDWQISANAAIFQGVTLDAREVDFFYSEKSRPVIGASVTIDSGAKVMGSLYIGDSARVGVNSVVLHSVPYHALAVGAPARGVQPLQAESS